jgi:hypothetical protein
MSTPRVRFPQVLCGQAQSALVAAPFTLDIAVDPPLQKQAQFSEQQAK